MKLTDTMNKSMKEILEECNVVNQQIHTDQQGNIQAIEIKFVPKSHQEQNKLLESIEF